jgi:hypothetical protein
MSATDPRPVVFSPAAVQHTAGRRRFLARLAATVGAVAIAPLIERGAGITDLLRAQGSPDGQTEPGLSDTDIVNYALTLEYLEATFYLRADRTSPLPSSASIAALDPDGGAMPGAVPGLDALTFPAPSTQSVPAFFRAVRDHEIIHVLALQSALGGAALPRAAFSFTFGDAFANAQNFTTTALALEDTGVSAYLGQAANVDDGGILGTAGSILGVEAEHAATVRLLIGQPVVPQNAAFDTARSTNETLAAAGGFVAAAPTLPFG